MLRTLASFKSPALFSDMASVWANGRFVDALLVFTIAALCVAGLVSGFDAAYFIRADALYPIQLLDFSLLDFRPPPPNRLFPDVAVHALLPWTGDVLDQKIAAGLVLFALTAIPIGFYKGPAVFAVAVALLAATGFQFLDSACHYALPLLVLLVQIARTNRAVEGAVLGLAVFSDLLVLIPLTVLLLDPAQRDRLAFRACAAAAGFALSALYADFGVAIVQLVAVLPVWALVVHVAYRLGLRDALCISIVVGLVVAAVAGLTPGRYALPVAASLVIAVTPLVPRPTFDWRYLAVPAVIAAVFLATVDTARARQIMADFDCLDAALAERGIANIAADHWTSKPLYFAARARGHDLTITQTDFREGDNHPWMAPYSFFGAPTPWAVHNARSCAELKSQNDPTYCGQASLAPVKSRESVCTVFTLYQYEQPVPIHYDGRPAGKIEANIRQLRSYLGKAIAVFDRLIGSAAREAAR